MDTETLMRALLKHIRWYEKHGGFGGYRASRRTRQRFRLIRALEKRLGLPEGWK